MSSEGKPMLTDPSSPSEGVVCQIDEITYLGIKEETDEHGDNVLTYFTNSKPQRIPQGIQAEPYGLDLKLEGLRLFKVYREGADTYDIVHVGTLTVLDGVAWIVGCSIYMEEPDLIDDDSSIVLPPFAVTYPFKEPATEEDMSRVEAEINIQKRDKLQASMKKAGYDTAGYGFELEPSPSFSNEEWRHNIYPDRCPYCDDLVARYLDFVNDNGEIERIEDRLCDNCGIYVPDANYDDTLVRKAEAQRRCKEKGETNNMDIDCGGSSNSATDELSSSFRNCASINCEGQTVSKDVLV